MSAILLLLKALPWPLYVAGIAIAAAAGIYLFDGTRIHILEHNLTEQTNRANGLQASILAAQKFATETAATEAADMKGIANEAQRLAARSRTDASAAVDAHVRLLERAAAVASAGQAAPAPEGSSTATGPGLVLTDVLRQSDERAGQLASYADQARIAGEACEHAYAALGAPESERGDDDKP